MAPKLALSPGRRVMTSGGRAPNDRDAAYSPCTAAAYCLTRVSPRRAEPPSAANGVGPARSAAPFGIPTRGHVTTALRRLAWGACARYTQPRSEHHTMRIFRHTGDRVGHRWPGAGQRGGDVTCLIRRCLTGDVEVTGIDRFPAARAAIAGRRPRDPYQPWRETTMRVRLVREPDDPDDPNTIAVLIEDGVPVGHVDRTRAIRMAPALDRFLGELGAKREFGGYDIDVRCTAVAWAEWDDAPPGSTDTVAVGMTLLVDDHDLGIKLAAPELPALV